LNRGASGPLGLAECRRFLDRIEAEFASWRQVEYFRPFLWG
jgi:hypothetical protein